MTQEHNDEFSSSDDLSSFAISEPENALPRVGLNDVPEMLRAACARAGWTQLMPGRDCTMMSRPASR